MEIIPPKKQEKNTLSVVAVGSLIVKNAMPSDKNRIAIIANTIDSDFIIIGFY
jgi:hypothetical protein